MIYFAEAVGIGHIKIGYTSKDDAVGRMANMQTGCPVPLRVLGLIPGTLDDEKDLHRRFAFAHVVGVGKEWFRPIPEILALIPDIETRQCDSSEVITRSVQIKVLTVGRKQFTKTLLNQLPCVDLDEVVNFLEIEDDLKRAIAASRPIGSDLQFWEEAIYWGWVGGEMGYTKSFGADFNKKAWYDHFIVERFGVLNKCKVFQELPGNAIHHNFGNNKVLYQTFSHLWKGFYSQWMDEKHHLYIGV